MVLQSLQNLIKLAAMVQEKLKPTSLSENSRNFPKFKNETSGVDIVFPEEWTAILISSIQRSLLLP